MNTPKLPSRYEDLDIAFRGRLSPNQPLIEAIQTAHASMKVSGGIRFLPVFGRSGCGKTSAARELSTHLPETYVHPLSRDAVQHGSVLTRELKEVLRSNQGRLIIVLIDQYEEAAAEDHGIPTSFVESLSLLDRGELRDQALVFLWLTTR